MVLFLALDRPLSIMAVLGLLLEIILTTLIYYMDRHQVSHYQVVVTNKSVGVAINLFVMKIIVSISLFVLFFSLSLPVKAEVWYDKLPKSGEYAPPPDSTAKAPKDFIDMNASEDSNTEDNESKTEIDNPSNDVGSVEIQESTDSSKVDTPSGSTAPVNALLVVLLVLAGSGFIIYLIWNQRPQ